MFVAIFDSNWIFILRADFNLENKKKSQEARSGEGWERTVVWFLAQNLRIDKAEWAHCHGEGTMNCLATTVVSFCEFFRAIFSKRHRSTDSWLFNLEAKTAKIHFEAKIDTNITIRCTQIAITLKLNEIVNNFKKASYSEDYNDCSAANRTSLGRSAAE